MHSIQTWDSSSLTSRLGLTNSSPDILIAKGLHDSSVIFLTVSAAMSNACPFIQTVGVGVFNWDSQIFRSIVLAELGFLSSTRSTVTTQLTSSASLPLLGIFGNKWKIKSRGKCAKEENEVLHTSTLKKKKDEPVLIEKWHAALMKNQV